MLESGTEALPFDFTGLVPFWRSLDPLITAVLTWAASECFPGSPLSGTNGKGLGIRGYSKTVGTKL